MEAEVEKLLDQFRRRFESRPRVFRAPGRVNLIGEHTDYNDGFVMPFAIDRHAIVGGVVRDDRIVDVYAVDLDEHETFDLAAAPKKRRGTWVDYVEGAIRCVGERSGVEMNGSNLMITSTVPIGAGLSSSAAIEIAIGYAVAKIQNVKIDPKELALAGQQTEHEFVGTRSGIMDQFASVFGREGNAMLLDCRSREIDYIPIENDDMAIAVIDTKVKHNLASSEYNNRRAECEEGVKLLREVLSNVRALRDVTMEDLEKYGDRLPEKIFRRCRHVVTENDRTLVAAEAFKRSDHASAGKLMFESHASLRDDYEVSCPELDQLVDIAGNTKGVFGARMTGGGFGGCTVNLVEKSAVDELKSVAVEQYTARFGSRPDFYIFHATNGASEVTL